MRKYNLPVINSKSNSGKIRKCLAAGFFAHAAKKDPREGYKTVIEGHQVYIHPSSSLFNKAPE